MLFEAFLQNPEQITFAGLFIAMLIWSMKTNDNREKRYLDTIEKLSKALNSFEDMKNQVERIHEKLGA